MKVYFAAPLFDTASQMFNTHIAKQIRHELPFLELYLPQENEALNDKMGYADSVTIFDGDNHYLDEADILIALLDGIEIDSGVSAEVGRFVAFKEAQDFAAQKFGKDVALNKHIYGLYTDVRRLGADNPQKIEALKKDPIENQFFYKNLYTVGAIKKHGKILYSVEDLVNELRYNHG
jgi:nucleoside 2-deoxyribosyltransferase